MLLGYVGTGMLTEMIKLTDKKVTLSLNIKNMYVVISHKHFQIAKITDAQTLESFSREAWTPLDDFSRSRSNKMDFDIQFTIRVAVDNYPFLLEQAQDMPISLFRDQPKIFLRLVWERLLHFE